MDLAFLTQALFAVGTFVLAFAFAASVGHAVMLASGRRALAAASAAAQALASGAATPAWAGVATGSFVQSRAAVAAAGPADFAAPSPLSGAARWLTVTSFALLFASMAVRAYIVGRGPWGNLFEFAVAFALQPLPIATVLDCADAALVMPPKSTWFEPKVLSGFVVHLLD